jgi:tetratricopeptide (TPR) repeat protein
MKTADLSPYKLMQQFAWFFTAILSLDVAEAGMAFERAIALARAADEPPRLGAEFGGFADIDNVVGVCLVRYADHLTEQGEVEAASSRAMESHQFRVRTNRGWRAESLAIMGRLALLRGDLTRAQTLLHEATEFAMAANAKNILGRWQPHLGLVMCYEGDAAKAHRLLDECLRMSTEMKHKFRLAQTTTYLAELALWEGKSDLAAQWLAQSLAHRADLSRTRLTATERIFVAARLAAAQQRYPRAATLFGLADMAHSRVHNAIGGPRRAVADEALATVRAALDPAAFDEAYSAGQRMALEQAYGTILAPGLVVEGEPDPTAMMGMDKLVGQS